MTLKVPGVPGRNAGTWTKGQKVPYFREVLRKKCTRKKIPEIAIVLSSLSKSSGRVRSGNCKQENDKHNI